MAGLHGTCTSGEPSSIGESSWLITVRDNPRSVPCFPHCWSRSIVGARGAGSYQEGSLSVPMGAFRRLAQRDYFRKPPENVRNKREKCDSTRITESPLPVGRQCRPLPLPDTLQAHLGPVPQGTPTECGGRLWAPGRSLMKKQKDCQPPLCSDLNKAPAPANRRRLAIG